MKKVYIVLTYTGTLLSSLIRVFTKDKYCHCSISLDKELNEMYSFGRLTAYNPIIGGFTREGINFGTFKRFKKTTAEILELKVSESSYKKIENIIDEYKHQRERYGYNFIGLVVAISGKRLKRRKHFYCSEFVKDVLNRAEVENNLPKIPKPEHFREINNTRLIYEGLLRNYNQA